MTPSAAIATDPVDTWLATFHQVPNEAVDHFLMGRVYLGSLERNEVHENLFRLFHSAPRRDRRVLDDAVYDWFARRLLAFPDGVAPARWADIFRNACAAVVRLHLEKTTTYLHQHYAPARDWLRTFYQGPARDPETALLRTLALTQRDQTLFPLWMHLCRLEEDCPWDYTALGLLGLQHLPDEQGNLPGGLDHIVFVALRDMAEALAHRVQPLKAAQEFWIITFKALLARFPRSDQFLRDEFLPLIRPGHHEIAADWLGKVRPRLRQHLTPGRRLMPASRRSHRPPSKQDFERIQALITGRPLDQVRSQIRDFIQAHECYAYNTGDAYSLVRAFDRLAHLLIHKDSQWAIRLVEAALRWDHRNPHLWMTRAQIDFHCGRLKDASRFLWQARREFPENERLRTFLAYTVKAQGRLEEAELIYRQAMDDFPDNVVCRTGLAEVLKAQDRLKEAEDVYRQATVDFPNNEVCRNGLAEVLKAQDRLKEAEDVYRQATVDFPNDEVCRNGLAEVLKVQDRLKEAEDVYRQATVDFPNNDVCRNGLAGVLKAQDRLKEAEDVYRQATVDFPNNSYCALGLALVLIRQGRGSEAWEVMEVAADRFRQTKPIQEFWAKLQSTKEISEQFLAQLEAKAVMPTAAPYANLPGLDLSGKNDLQDLGSSCVEPPDDKVSRSTSERKRASEKVNLEAVPSYDKTVRSPDKKADRSIPPSSGTNGTVNEEELGLAQLYRLTARRTDTEKVNYRQQSLKFFDAVLARQATHLFALLGKGFALLDADPVAAETFFVNLQEQGVNRLGFSLGHIRALVLQGKPVPPSDWSALRERFPASRNLTRLAQSLAELHHPNGRTIKVLNDLRLRLPAPDADLDRSLESLPRDLWDNEAWIIRNIRTRLLSDVPSDRPIEKDDLPAILENYQKSGVALHGLIEQSLAIDSRR